MTCWRSLKSATKGNSNGNTRTRYAAGTRVPACPTDIANAAITPIAAQYRTSGFGVWDMGTFLCRAVDSGSTGVCV
jgi:hypothetical protein